MNIAHRLDAFPEYVFSRLARSIAAVEKESGRKVKNFGIGSPDIAPSPIYVDTLQNLLREPGMHLYPGYRGTEEFNRALAEWYKRRFDVAVADEEILPLLGAKDGCAHLPLALADVGAEILMPDPGYPGFAGPALMIGAQPIYYTVHAGGDFRATAQDIESKITAKTAFIWVNFPSNPTGATATLDDLRPIVDIALKRGTPIVYDNAYSEITFDGFVAPSILEIPEAKGVAVELGSFSKTFSFAGYRMGWMVGNKDIVAALAKVKSQTDSGMSLPLQSLGAFALTHQDTAWHATMIDTYKSRRDIIARKLHDLGLTFDTPKGSLYIWAKIPDTAEDSESYVLELLRQKQVFFAPGSAFGKKGARYVRISICVNVDNIDEYL